MTHRRALRLLPLLSLLAVSACVVTAPTPPISQSSQAPLVRKQAVSSMVTGKLLAPANIISNDGASIISNDGASILTSGGLIISNDGASVISTGGLNLRTVQQAQSVTEVRIAGAEVFLSADVNGAPVPGLPVVKTDKEGRYSLPNVPAGHTLILTARFKTQDGKNAELRTLLQPGAAGNSVNLDAATTLITAAVLEGKTGGLGEFNSGSFSRTVDETRSQLKPGDLPDWSNPRAVVAKINEILARLSAVEGKVGEIENTVDALKEALEQNKRDNAAIKEDLETLKAQSPAPAPTATPVPSASPSAASPAPAGTSTVYRLVDDWKAGTPGKGPWTYATFNGLQRGEFQWGDVYDRGNQFYLGNDPIVGIYWYSGVFLDMFPEHDRIGVYPGGLVDPVIEWKAPAAGKLTIQGRAKSTDESVDGVGTNLYRGDVLNGRKAPLRTGLRILAGQELEVGLPAPITVVKGETIVFHFHRGPQGDTNFDTVAVGLTYTLETGP